MMDLSQLHRLHEIQEALDKEPPLDETVPAAYEVTGLRHKDCQGLVEEDRHYKVQFCITCNRYVPREHCE